MPVRIVILLCIAALTRAQTAEYVYRDSKDTTVNCYLKITPNAKPVALIIRDYSSLPDITKKGVSSLHELAARNGVMTIFTVTSRYFPELYYDQSGPALLDDIVHEVLIAHDIPQDNIFIGGISASGTRALRYAEYCERGRSKYGHRVKAVFAVDPPLDLERFYHSSVRIIRRNYEHGNLWEANLIVKSLHEKLGGTPMDFRQRYIDASVYTQTDSLGGNAIHYKNLPIRFYHEPDIDWWLENRHETYYEFNSFDIAAFVNDLRTLGNTRVELVTTHGRGFDKEGKPNPHTWSIVDENELIAWIDKQIDRK